MLILHICENKSNTAMNMPKKLKLLVHKHVFINTCGRLIETELVKVNVLTESNFPPLHFHGNVETDVSICPYLILISK